jgi:dihydrofolate reductase
MSKVVVKAFSVSLEGFGAGPDQSAQAPLGIGGERLHEWFHPTKTFRQKVVGGVGGTRDVDDAFAKHSFDNIGAWIMGRNMFGPIRGEWSDESWQGWWGDNPPYHVPVFVLTHYTRKPLTLAGDNTFHFVTGGIHEALDLAKQAAAGKDIRIGGGVSTVHQYLQAGLIDEMHLAIAPTLLGRGESLFAGIDLNAGGFTYTEHVGTTNALHVVLTKKAF